MTTRLLFSREISQLVDTEEPRLRQVAKQAAQLFGGSAALSAMSRHSNSRRKAAVGGYRPMQPLGTYIRDEAGP
jgi:hypothetical protein